MISYAIGIPTLNRADLLEESLKKYVVDFPHTPILIRDNGPQALTKYPLVQQIGEVVGNMGVAASWNLLCTSIFNIGCSHAIILNDDVYWGKAERDVNDFLAKYPDKSFYVTPMDWCNFIMPKKTFQQIGGFDEQFFPAYFEDNDYTYRLKLKGMSAYKHPFLLPYVYRQSMTMERDVSVRNAYYLNKKRYIAKWGGVPTCETKT